MTALEVQRLIETEIKKLGQQVEYHDDSVPQRTIIPRCDSKYMNNNKKRQRQKTDAVDVGVEDDEDDIIVDASSASIAKLIESNGVGIEYGISECQDADLLRTHGDSVLQEREIELESTLAALTRRIEDTRQQISAVNEQRKRHLAQHARAMATAKDGQD